MLQSKTEIYHEPFVSKSLSLTSSKAIELIVLGSKLELTLIEKRNRMQSFQTYGINDVSWRFVMDNVNTQVNRW